MKIKENLKCFEPSAFSVIAASFVLLNNHLATNMLNFDCLSICLSFKLYIGTTIQKTIMILLACSWFFFQIELGPHFLQKNSLFLVNFF